MKEILKDIIRWFFKFVKIKDIIILESNSDLSDNSYAVYMEMLKYKLNYQYKIIWFVKNPKEYKDYKEHNVKFVRKLSKNIFYRIKELYYLSSAKYIFFSHMIPMFKLNHGEVFINLWHGSALKNINFIDFQKNFDYVLCSSDFFKKKYNVVFDIPLKKLLVLGNPRTDFLKQSSKLTAFLPFEDMDFIVWMPTFRKNINSKRQDFIQIDNGEVGLPIIKKKNDLNELNKYLKNKKTCLIIKPHPAQDVNEYKVQDCSNIIIIENKDLDANNINLYSFLGQSKALITDYSSVYIDYLMVDKPIIFTIDDIKCYKTGFIVDEPLDCMPGEKVKNYNEFIKSLKNVIEGKDLYKKERKEINNLFNKYKDDKIAERILKYFKLI